MTKNVWVCLHPQHCWRLSNSAADPHNLIQSGSVFNFDVVDPTFHSYAYQDPATRQCDANLQPPVLDFRPSTAPLWASTPQFWASTSPAWASMTPFCESRAPEVWIWCGCGSCFWLWCGCGADFGFHSCAVPDPTSQNEMMRIRNTRLKSNMTSVLVPTHLFWYRICFKKKESKRYICATATYFKGSDQWKMRGGREAG